MNNQLTEESQSVEVAETVQNDIPSGSENREMSETEEVDIPSGTNVGSRDDEVDGETVQMAETVQNDIPSGSENREMSEIVERVTPSGTNVRSGDNKHFPTATKYVIITKDNIKQEVQPGDHLAHNMSLYGITYWHEFLVASCNWEAGTLSIYERVRVPEKGFRKSDFWINNLWDQEKLCKKYIYDKGEISINISFEQAENLLLKEEKEIREKKKKEEGICPCCRDWKLYSVLCNNCEHTVRGLKTGKFESTQVQHSFISTGQQICLFLIKLWKIICLVSKYGGRPLLYSLIEFLVDNCSSYSKNCIICKWFAEIDIVTIGVELIIAVVLNLAFWLYFEIRICREFYEKKKPFCKAWLCCGCFKDDDLEEANYEDELKIMRYNMAGSFIGTLFVIAIAFGLHQIPCNDIFLLVIESVLFFVVTFLFSAIGKNIGLSKVREKHKKYWEKKQSTQQETRA